MDQKYHLFYELAYNLAQVAYDQDEVPVGAVIIKDSSRFDKRHNFLPAETEMQV